MKAPCLSRLQIYLSENDWQQRCHWVDGGSTCADDLPSAYIYRYRNCYIFASLSLFICNIHVKYIHLGTIPMG